MVSLNYYYLARNILKRGRRKNIPLLLVSLFLIAGHFAVEYSNARNIYGDVQNADWQAVNSWILSSSCSADTGAFLVSCQSDGSLAPYEDISLADDIGHALALNLYSAFTGIEAEFYQAARVNVLLNFVSAGILAMLLYFSLGAFSAFVFSAFVPFAYASLIYLSPHPALTGVASLSVAAVIVMSPAARSAVAADEVYCLVPAVILFLPMLDANVFINASLGIKPSSASFYSASERLGFNFFSFVTHFQRIN